jgi:hypothetical protein
MTSLQALLGYVGLAILWLILVGVFWRRRYREWLLLPVFLAIIAIYSSLITLSFDRFHSPEIYIGKEALLHVVRLVMALELALRIFRAFPGAMATLRRVLLVILVVTAAVVVTGMPAEWTYESFVGQVQPRVVNAAVWLFTGIAGLILWYRLPVSPFQKAVVLSYVPYLLIFTAVMDRLGSLGWQRGVVFIYLNQLAYLALLSYWAYVSWRQDRPSRGPEPETPLLG